MKCKRCGLCCMSLPSWKDLTNIEKAIIRQYDTNAEFLFKEVVRGKCPNLIFEGIKAKCLIYKERYRFCKALKPFSKNCLNKKNKNE